MIRIALYLLILPAFLSPSLDEKLNWPIGKWRTVESEGQFSEEHWRRTKDGGFRGIGTQIQNGDTLFQESMRINRQKDEWFYRADLENQKPVLFKLIDYSSTHWVFTNTKHDYPQRIEYRLVEEGHLNATVSLSDGSKPNRWEYFKVP